MGEMARALQEHLNKNNIRRIPIKKDNPEQREQMSYIAWLRMAHPEVVTLVCPIVKYGGNAKQRLIQGGIQKRMGYLKGTLDIFHCLPKADYHGLVIEMKYGDGDLSLDQEKMILRLSGLKYCCHVCYTASEAVRAFSGYFKL